VRWVYNAHLPCLLPQHGEGKKHERRIFLENWQHDFVAEAPGVPPRLHPLGRLRLREPHGPV